MNRVCFSLLLGICLIPLTAVAQVTPPGNLSGAGGSSSSIANAEPKILEDSLGEAKNVHRLGDLFFSGQFTPEDVEVLKERGIKRVITLRTDGEVDWDEEAALKAAGIELIKIPFRKPESLTDEVFDKARKTLSDDTSKKTLFHCGSANRVGGVWMTHRVLDQGVPMDKALEEAKTIGLRTPFIQEKAVDYIQRQQQKKSVKPGINDSFTDPELDVDQFVKRFEVESREVYLNRNEIVAAAGIEPGDRVADVGAGTGLFTRLFADRVGDAGWVFAVDIAPRFIEHITREAHQADQRNITGVLCSEDSVNLPPNSVDVVFICDTYHHFEYPQSTMASIHRALKDDGHLVVIDFDRIEGKSRPWLIGHVRAGKEVFRAEIQDAGFQLVEEKPMKGFEENYFLKFSKSK